MDRRDFILHTGAALVGAVVGTAPEEVEPVPDRVHDTHNGEFVIDPWHFHWDQPMTRLTEKELREHVASGVPTFNFANLDVKDAGRRPMLLEQRLHQLPEPVYYLVGNAILQISLHGVVVAHSPYDQHVGVDKVMGDYSLCMNGWRDISQKKDSPEARHVAEWICLNVNGGTGWEQIMEHHKTDWLAGLCLDVRVKNIPLHATDDAKALWNAKFRDALTHGPNRK